MNRKITKSHIDKIKHALGLDYKDIPFRNHYVSGKDCDGYDELMDLVNKRYMTKGLRFDQVTFWVTAKGAKLVGISRKDFEQSNLT